MANEVEASELAVASEGPANEEVLLIESQSSEALTSGDIVTEGSMKEENEKLKTETELEVNKKPNSEANEEVKQSVLEPVSQPLPDSDVSKEDVKESVPEPISQSEPLPDNKVLEEEVKEPEAVSQTKPTPDSGVMEKEGNELKPEPTLDSGVMETNEKELTPESKSQTKPILDSDAVETDEKELTSEPILQAEPILDSDVVEADKKELTPESKSQPKPVLDSNLVEEAVKELALDSTSQSEHLPDSRVLEEEVKESVPAAITQPEPLPDYKVLEVEGKESVPAAASQLESLPDSKVLEEEVKGSTPDISQAEPALDSDIEEGNVKEFTSEHISESEMVPAHVVAPGSELEMEPESEIGAEAKAEPELENELELGIEQEEEEEQEQEEEDKAEKPLDDDQDRRNPQYIPKGGAFYEHDNRTSLEDVENKDPQESEKKKKSWKESKDSKEWLHDRYNESDQQPKSTAEIIEAYGYDIRRDEAPPRARRRRKYGRGPDKYDRSWEDEQAYLIKQNSTARRGRKKHFGKDEFPPLPNQKSDSSVSKPVQRPSIRKKEEEGGSKSVSVKVNGNEKSPASSHVSRPSHSGNQNTVHTFHSNRKNYSTVSKKVNDDDIKPFRNDDNKWKTTFKHGKQDDFPKPIKTQSIRHTDPPFKRSMETSKTSSKDPQVSHITDGINQMTFLNKQANVRDIRPKANGPEENKVNEPETDSPASRQNPKRYSKIRKGFTGIFPPEEVPELEQTDIHKLQQEQQKSQHLNITQPLNMQNVMKRYTGTFGNISNCVTDFVPSNTSYLQARPIISGIPQQAMSPQGIHQQTLSPQGIPQQALSPQVTGLPTIELQQNPLGQPNFVPQPMYMDAHFPSDVMGPFSGYSPYSGSQTGDVYQPSRGITYYNTECQSTGQKRPPPPRRQKAAIPIMPPE